MRLRKFLRKIHRWIGIIASVWLLLLATTGFLLQHKDDWKLDEKYTNSPLLLSLYEIGDQYISFEDQNHTIAQLDHQIFINSQSILKLEDAIIGAIFQDSNWIIATNSQLIWINTEGQILQTMDDMDGLPLPIEKLGNNNNNILVQSNNQTISIDTFQPTRQAITWSIATNSEKLKESLIQTSSHNYLSYQQLIFDLHAGITSPSLFNDIAALALIFLSLSGIIIFFKKSFRKQRRFY